MSYLVLARKYRPQTFADVVGQAPIVTTLTNSLARNRVAHAILFSGVRGVGKTTLARIMAKAINCESNSDIKPCNSCRSCVEITSGQSLDLHEIDGASNRGIQEIRELKERIRFLPTSSRYKIIIIDEVHMLTTEAFNALLKTLEEPPEHVYFMFATTELHKIPITILSRCQRYELKRIGSNELTRHFQNIAEKEQVDIDADGLALIVREAEGSVRDGMSLLDQIFSFGDQHISTEDVIQVLGLTDRSILFTLTEALLTGDKETALKTLNEAFDYGLDIKRFTNDLLECMRTLLLTKIGGLQELIDLPEDEIDRFQKLCNNSGIETIHMKLNQLLAAVEEIRHTTQPRLALETSFLKIIESGNVVAVSELIGRVDSLLKTVSDPPTSVNHHLDTKKKPSSEIEAQPPHYLQEQPAADLQPPLPAPPKEIPAPPASPATPPEPVPDEKDDSSSSYHELHEKPDTPQAEKDKICADDTANTPKDWDKFITFIKEKRVWMATDLTRADRVEEKDGDLMLHFSDPTSCTLLSSKENLRALTKFALDFFKKDLRVRFIVPELEKSDAYGNDKNSPSQLRRQLSNDPLVQMTVEIFNGQVGDIRVRKPKTK